MNTKLVLIDHISERDYIATSPNQSVDLAIGEQATFTGSLIVQVYRKVGGICREKNCHFCETSSDWKHKRWRFGGVYNFKSGLGVVPTYGAFPNTGKVCGDDACMRGVYLRKVIRGDLEPSPLVNFKVMPQISPLDVGNCGIDSGGDEREPNPIGYASLNSVICTTEYGRTSSLSLLEPIIFILAGLVTTYKIWWKLYYSPNGWFYLVILLLGTGLLFGGTVIFLERLPYPCVSIRPI
jgi:hypothetical protein